MVESRVSDPGEQEALQGVPMHFSDTIDTADIDWRRASPLCSFLLDFYPNGCALSRAEQGSMHLDDASRKSTLELVHIVI